MGELFRETFREAFVRNILGKFTKYKRPKKVLSFAHIVRKKLFRGL
jgi:hypothetical protein